MARKGLFNALIRGGRRLPSSVEGLEQKLRSTIGRTASPAYIPRLIVESSLWSRSARECIESMGFDASKTLENEFAKQIKGLKDDTSKKWPDYFDAGDESARFLYLLIRLVRPTTVLETGVANGKSTRIILAAMDANDHGHLHSIDMTRNVGQLFGGQHDRWTLHVTHGRSQDLKRVLDSIERPQVFIHDADHSYKSQMREYSLAASYLPAEGFLLSDDVDSSWAFRDFCQKRNLKMGLLGDDTKVFGFTRVQR